MPSIHAAEEARVLARLETDVARAERRNERLRDKAASQAIPAEDEDQIEAMPSGDSQPSSVRVEVGSHSSSLPQPSSLPHIARPSPRRSSSASSRHFPPPGFGRAPSGGL